MLASGPCCRFGAFSNDRRLSFASPVSPRQLARKAELYRQQARGRALRQRYGGASKPKVAAAAENDRTPERNSRERYAMFHRARVFTPPSPRRALRLVRHAASTVAIASAAARTPTVPLFHVRPSRLSSARYECYTGGPPRHRHIFV